MGTKIKHEFTLEIESSKNQNKQEKTNFYVSLSILGGFTLVGLSVIIFFISLTESGAKSSNVTSKPTVEISSSVEEYIDSEIIIVEPIAVEVIEITSESISPQAHLDFPFIRYSKPKYDLRQER